MIVTSLFLFPAEAQRRRGFLLQPRRPHRTRSYRLWMRSPSAPLRLCGRSFLCRHTNNLPRSAFTLVEIALATLVLSLGLLTLFGLGRLAMENAARAENDTRTALFADNIFSSLRSVSEDLCATGGPSAWAVFWTGFSNGTIPLPIPLPEATAFSNPKNFSDQVLGNGTWHTNFFYARPDIHGPSTNAIPEWGVRFAIEVELTNDFVAVSGITNQAHVTLHVAPGAYGTISESRTFFTLFTEHGTLP